MINTKDKRSLLLLFLLSATVISGCATSRQARRIETEVKRVEQKLDAMLEKPAPVTKEDAVAIATRFAGLKEVEPVRQPRVISSHTQTFNVMGNDGKGDILIGVNPATGEVIKMVKQCPYPGRDAENAVISGEEAQRKAREFLSRRGLPPVPEGFVMDKPKLKTAWNKKHWEIVWRHYVGEVEMTSDFVSFSVNAETGEIVSYSKVYHDVEVSHLPKLTADEAIRRAREILGRASLEHYDRDMKVLKTTLKILYPNDYFEDFVYHWSDRQTLAWVVQFGVDSEPAVDIWIDAHSGELLGGEIYERPVPELWGIPDQTADITNIWQPALNLMQYNTTTHTFLGDANEADIVNSIANGEYFILQTHGSTTATAEYARISHSGTTDQQRLTPDEIPNNDLRYALVSCCNSGHDGSGADFKDEFINHGADFFQGYVESMNPDPYELSLVRYLAEGQTHYSAHNNAVADVSPWFTIVLEYGPPYYCFNQLRLAPLLVDVSAPSSAWFTATIRASVRNRENARHTTATNVMAKLQLPAGFTVISGANPQTTPTLMWTHSWTAEWKVRAPWWTWGRRTFDVIVRSDNLGVAVDDFDDPYHKVDVNFGYLAAFMVMDYLELNKWWELAIIQYPRLPESERIISLSRDLEGYTSTDDVQKDPSSFLGQMLSIADLEYSFSRNFFEPPEAVPKTVRQYQEAVEAKIIYLKRLREEGLRDVDETLTELSVMQARINAAALTAFWRQQ